MSNSDNSSKPKNPPTPTATHKKITSEDTNSHTLTNSIFSEATKIGVEVPQSITQITGRVAPVLHISSGSEQGRIIPIKENSVFTVGRGRDCELVLQDPSCSRAHAKFTRSADTSVYLEDLASTNGTRVNGLRISEPIELADDDHIQFGDNSMLKFSLSYEKETERQIEVYTRATRDPLTNALNKSQFEEALERELAFHNRSSAGLSLIIFDIDHFKKTNDTYGHLAGDAVLKELGKRVNLFIRKEDIFARIGGEEFALVSRSKNLKSAEAFANRVRTYMEENAVIFEDFAIKFTISSGLCFLGDQVKIKAINDIIALADEALYKAKNGGRNQVVTVTPSSNKE